MKLIKEFLFGKRANAVCQIQLGFKSTYPQNKLSYLEWCNEFKVSVLHNRKPVYLN